MTPNGEAKQRQQWKAALAATDDCLTLEQLSLHAHGSPEGTARGRASAHLASCARCQSELAMLEEFESAAPRPGESAAVSWIAAELKRRAPEIELASGPSTSSREPSSTRGRTLRQLLGSRRLSAGALSVAAMLVAVTAAVYLRGSREPSLSSDGAAGAVVLRSQEVVALAPKGDLEERPTELLWHPVPGAVRYSVKLMEVDRAELWQASSEKAGVPVPGSVQAKIVPGKTLLWQVTAFDASGKALATSQLERFRVAVRPGSNE